MGVEVIEWIEKIEKMSLTELLLEKTKKQAELSDLENGN